MSTQENGSLGLTKKSILERLDTLIELNKKIYEANLANAIIDVQSSIPAESVITDIAKTEAEKVKTILSAELSIVYDDKIAGVIAEVEAKRMSTENSLKEFATNIAKVEASLAAEKVRVIIPDTIAITDIANVEAVKEAGKVKTEISAELVTTVTDEVSKQLNII